MGCDVHPYFEYRDDDGRWHPLWKPRPHPDWWWERMMDAALDSDEDSSAAVLFTGIIGDTKDDNDARYEALKTYFQSLSLEEAETLFGHGDLMVWDFHVPYEARARNYEWFALLAGVRGYTDALWEPRDVPPDVSREVKAEIDHWDSDGHTHSWLMVSELFEREDVLEKFNQYQWIKERIKEPDRTRMVFFFDN